jgi:hypothetical protein
MTNHSKGHLTKHWALSVSNPDTVRSHCSAPRLDSITTDRLQSSDLPRKPRPRPRPHSTMSSSVSKPYPTSTTSPPSSSPSSRLSTRAYSSTPHTLSASSRISSHAFPQTSFCPSSLAPICLKSAPPSLNTRARQSFGSVRQTRIRASPLPSSPIWPRR